MADKIIKGKKTLVLVGTYRSECREWLLTKHGKERRSYYNFPFHGTDKEAQSFKGIGCLFLFSTEYAPILRTVKYVGIITGEELKTRLDYPSRENPHSDRYVLFETLGEIDLKTARAIRSDAESRFVIGVDKVARSHHKWIDILSRYVSSTKVAFDDWAQANKIPKWVCNAAAYMPKSKGRMFAQLDFITQLDMGILSTKAKKVSRIAQEAKKDGKLTCVEICAGAGGQAIGLERAGFTHVALVEYESEYCDVLKNNNPAWNVICADVHRFDGHPYQGVDLLAGGVPCPPFSVASKQLGKDDERDLFPEALRLLGEIRPKAVMIENVRGLLDPKFDDYRKSILHQIDSLGYDAQIKLLHASDYGVPQIRPRVVIVGIRKDLKRTFSYPTPTGRPAPTVGEALRGMMSARGWRGANAWARRANAVAPTIVGGSKKHGGPDLGPTRARKAWAELGVDGLGIANEPPKSDFVGAPKLTKEMIAVIQGFPLEWNFGTKKTAACRMIGNAFPPPVAEAVGMQIRRCLTNER